MLELIKKVERAVTYFLAGLMAIVVVLAVGELAWLIIKDIITPPVLMTPPAVGTPTSWPRFRVLMAWLKISALLKLF